MQLRFTFLVLIVAVVASVFAIWPAVADAPWEEEAVIVVETEAPDPRCEAAHIMKAEATVSLAEIPRRNSRGSPQGQLETVIEDADRDIRRYC
ncbi:hypothetical protein LCGC14_1239680 [marine sediment metagenome]|uniref:Uncharacterized protein n=1 Tax=marine sediment metagenome TaxID=412755 RepID=A0A0F9NNF1_9ZZZZ